MVATVEEAQNPRSCRQRSATAQESKSATFMRRRRGFNLSDDRTEARAIREVGRPPCDGAPRHRLHVAERNARPSPAAASGPAPPADDTAGDILGSGFSSSAIEVRARQKRDVGVSRSALADPRQCAFSGIRSLTRRPVREKLILGAVRGPIPDYLPRDRHRWWLLSSRRIAGSRRQRAPGPRTEGVPQGGPGRALIVHALNDGLAVRQANAQTARRGRSLRSAPSFAPRKHNWTARSPSLSTGPCDVDGLGRAVRLPNRRTGRVSRRPPTGGCALSRKPRRPTCSMPVRGGTGRRFTRPIYRVADTRTAWLWWTSTLRRSARVRAAEKPPWRAMRCRGRSC